MSELPVGPSRPLGHPPSPEAALLGGPGNLLGKPDPHPLGFLDFDSTQPPPEVRMLGPFGQMPRVPDTLPGIPECPPGLLRSERLAIADHLGLLGPLPGVEDSVGVPGGQEPMDFEEQKCYESRERGRNRDGLRGEFQLGVLPPVGERGLGTLGQVAGVLGSPPGIPACPPGLLRSPRPAIADPPGLLGPDSEDSVRAPGGQGPIDLNEKEFNKRREIGRNRDRVRGESPLKFLPSLGERRPGSLGQMLGVIWAPPGMPAGPPGLLGSPRLVVAGHSELLVPPPGVEDPVRDPVGQEPMNCEEQDFNERRERGRNRDGVRGDRGYRYGGKRDGDWRSGGRWEVREDRSERDRAEDSGCLPKKTLEEIQKDPYYFDVNDENIIESYCKVKKLAIEELCKQLVLEIASIAVDHGREVKLDSIFNSVLADKSSSSDEFKDNKLKRIFDEVVGLKKDEQKKVKKSLDDIFMDVMPKVKVRNSENQDQQASITTKACSENCPNQHCFEIPEQRIDSIRSKLAAMRISELHNFLLQRLNSQQELGLDSLNIFVVDAVRFCHNSFQSYFGVTDYLLKKVLLEHQGGSTRFIHGNKGNLYESPKRDEAIAFILKFSEVFSENLPDRSCLRLPSYLTIKTIFNYYCERTEDSRRVSEREFYSVFKCYFGDVSRKLSTLPRVVFQAFHTHPVCVSCSRISDLRKSVKSESEANYAEMRKRTHMIEIRSKYLKFASRRELSIRYSDDYLHIGIDDMDQRKLESPYFCQNTKELSNILKLNNHLTGVIVTSGKLIRDRAYMVFVNNDQYAQDSNKTISILFKILSNFQSKTGMLPRKLLLQSDNCVKDLKNQIVLSFYYLLVEKNIFEEVLVTSMPVGHTHNDVDWMFGLIAQKLKRIDIPTFDALKTELSNIEIQSQKLKVTEMTHTSDFKKFIENGHLLKIEGFRSFSQFMIRKDNKTTGLYLKYDELDDNFQFPNAISLLQNIPACVKLEVSPFRQETAYGEIFDSVWKKYIPSLTPKFTEDKIYEIKNEWEMRIKFLIDLKESSFQAFDFQTLKPQTPPASIQVASRHLPILSQERNVAVTATFYPIDMSRLTVLDLKKDTSLVLYTVTKKWRPWIGLYVELSDDGNYVTVQWVKKEKQNYILHLKNDGSPYLSSVPVQSIMFADVLENLCLEDSREGPYKMQNFVKSEIANAYIERDKNLDGS